MEKRRKPGFFMILFRPFFFRRKNYWKFTFDRAETEKYILSHLAYAGGRQDIFTDRALDDIYKESTGIPRRINRICEKSLMYASQQGKRLIDEHLVRYIIDHEMLGGDV